MSIAFPCDKCSRELRVSDHAVGRRVRCPDCDTLLTVPDPATLAAKPKTPSDKLEESLEVLDEDEILEELEPLVELEPLQPMPPAVPPPRPVPKKLRPSKKLPVASQTTPDEPPLLLPPRKQPEDLIDMTAMVDIVFFLLIFFLVTSLQALESVMELPTPQSTEGGVSTGKSLADLENDPNYITVRIEDDDSIWVEDTQVFSDQDLALRLRAARQEGPRGLLVIGDADASHGSAVRVFDAGAGAGVTGISLIVQEQVSSQ
jgi:biopolymer transport protein ExbD